MNEAFIVQEIGTSTKGRCGLTKKELNPFPPTASVKSLNLTALTYVTKVSVSVNK